MSDHSPQLTLAAPGASPESGSSPSSGYISESLQNIPAKPLKLYSVIYADPPWCYDNTCSQGGVREQYPTMNDEDICGLRVPAAKDAVLYLWATAPRLPTALDVMLAWGFAYKSCAIWDKVRFGIGYWFRGQHELLLCGVRGNVKPPAIELRIASVIRSAKADNTAGSPTMCAT